MKHPALLVALVVVLCSCLLPLHAADSTPTVRRVLSVAGPPAAGAADADAHSSVTAESPAASATAAPAAAASKPSKAGASGYELVEVDIPDARPITTHAPLHPFTDDAAALAQARSNSTLRRRAAKAERPLLHGRTGSVGGGSGAARQAPAGPPPPPQTAAPGSSGGGGGDAAAADAEGEQGAGGGAVGAASSVPPLSDSGPPPTPPVEAADGADNSAGSDDGGDGDSDSDGGGSDINSDGGSDGDDGGSDPTTREAREAARALRGYFTPLLEGEGEARVRPMRGALAGAGAERRSERREGRASERGGGEGASSSGGGGGSGGAQAPAAAAVLNSMCLRVKDGLLQAIQSTLRSTLEWTVQEGSVDFGFLGDERLVACSPNCGFTNPSSPYGLTLLPLAPAEGWRAKARAPSTPSYVSDHLKSDTGGGSRQLGEGFAPVYQLAREEVVLLAGCAPPQSSSRYFAATPYMYSTWLNDTQRWLTVFGSMGDSRALTPIHLTAQPHPPAPQAPPQPTTTTLAKHMHARTQAAAVAALSTGAGLNVSRVVEPPVFLQRLGTALPLPLALPLPAFPLLQAVLDSSSGGPAGGGGNADDADASPSQEAAVSGAAALAGESETLSSSGGADGGRAALTRSSRSGGGGSVSSAAAAASPLAAATDAPPSIITTTTGSGASASGAPLFDDLASSFAATFAAASPPADSSSSSATGGNSSSSDGNSTKGVAPSVAMQQGEGDAAVQLGVSTADASGIARRGFGGIRAAPISERRSDGNGASPRVRSSSRITTRDPTHSPSPPPTGTEAAAPKQPQAQATRAPALRNTYRDDSPLDAFFVTLMTSSPAAAERVRAALAPLLALLQLPPSVINILPIPQGFLPEDVRAASPRDGSGSGMRARDGLAGGRGGAGGAAEDAAMGPGLGPRDPYYMLLLRNIVPKDRLDSFIGYADAAPIRAWRLTPRTARAAAAASGGGLRPAAAVGSLARTMQQAASTVGASSPAAAGLLLQDSSADGDMQQLDYLSALVAAGSKAFPPPTLLPRQAFPPQSEAWLLPAFNHLLQRLHVLFQDAYALAYSLGAGSALGSMGVDSGADCLAQRLDYCNGDNRDSQYLSTFPFIRLDSSAKFVLVVGVSHTATGLASYFNVAASDPVARLGLSDFDDSEVGGSAHQYLVGGPYAHLAPYLYVAMFARDCQGLPYCKEIASEGPRSAPLSRDLILTLRAYANPHTGVGPAPEALVMYRSVALVPKEQARAADNRPAVDPMVFDQDPCMGALLAHTQCAQGPDPACCDAARVWHEAGCWCSQAGLVLQEALPPLAGRSMLVSVNRMCRIPGRPPLSCGGGAAAAAAAGAAAAGAAAAAASSAAASASSGMFSGMGGGQ